VGPEVEAAAPVPAVALAPDGAAAVPVVVEPACASDEAGFAPKREGAGVDVLAAGLLDAAAPPKSEGAGVEALAAGWVDAAAPPKSEGAGAGVLEAGWDEAGFGANNEEPAVFVVAAGCAAELAPP